MLELISEDEKRKRGKKDKSVKVLTKKTSKDKSVKVLTKKTSKEKEQLVEKLGLKEKGKKRMEVKKTIRIPVHYDTTKTKIDILDNLTARLTYCMRLISKVVEDLVKDNEKNDNDIDNLDDILKLKVIIKLFGCGDRIKSYIKNGKERLKELRKDLREQGTIKKERKMRSG